MRFATLVAAFGAACLAVPAQADPHSYSVLIFGDVTGTQNVYDPSLRDCDGSPMSEYCNREGPWTGRVSATINIFDETPTGYFDYGLTYLMGEFSGTILAYGPGLTGVDLDYVYYQRGGFDYRYGTAPTFSAILLSIDGVGVPEPATWAMMVVGFGAMGAAMRRRVRVRYA